MAEMKVDRIKMKIWEEIWRAAKRVWAEDDATVGCQGHENVEDGFLKLYGQKLDLRRVELMSDHGDSMLTVIKINEKVVIVCRSYPGNSEIRELP